MLTQGSTTALGAVNWKDYPEDDFHHSMAEVALEMPASFGFLSESLRILAYPRIVQKNEVEKMVWASEMAPQIKVIATKPANQSSNPTWWGLVWR